MWSCTRRGDFSLLPLLATVRGYMMHPGRGGERGGVAVKGGGRCRGGAAVSKGTNGRGAWTRRAVDMHAPPPRRGTLPGWDHGWADSPAGGSVLRIAHPRPRWKNALTCCSWRGSFEDCRGCGGGGGQPALLTREVPTVHCHIGVAVQARAPAGEERAMSLCCCRNNRLVYDAGRRVAAQTRSGWHVSQNQGGDDRVVAAASAARCPPPTGRSTVGGPTG